MKKAYNWLTNNILGLAVLFFLAFIPLYPKLPIINVIRTWVYIRLEDFLVAGAVAVYLLFRLRERRLPQSPLTAPILLYWGIGILSAVYSILFIGPKLVGYFPHLVVLHFLRRVEYMMLFFMAFDAVSRKKSLLTALIFTLAGTTACIIIYGFGQKFFGFPAFLTMNEEFAKGIPLRLPPTARIPSTFAGHYDLAAFVVLTIPILTAFIFAAKKLWQKGVFFLLSLGSLVMLLLTQSRTSFLVYLTGMSAMLLWYKKKWLILPVILLSFFLLNFVSGASERFYKTFRYNDVIVDLSTGKPVGTLATLEGGTAVIQKSESPAVENLPTGSQYIGLPPAQETATSAGKQVKTITFYNSVDLTPGSGDIATISGSFLIQKALVYDISITTRLQGQWPIALAAFKRNILLGSGFSTLSVASDGDYMRMLGETGILGTMGFLGILLTAFVFFFKKKESLDRYPKAFVVGVFGGLVGLMFNAILIDVFEASKVAFTLWLLLGAAMALLSTASFTLREYLGLLWRSVSHTFARVLYLFLAAVILFGSSVSNYFVADDFSWLRWAASTPFSDIFTFFTNSEGFFYRPIPKLWYTILYALFWLKPEGYHVMSLVLAGLSAFLVYLLMTNTGVKRSLALLFSLLFTVLSVHHENIFWISGQSSLLSAVGMFGSIALLLLQARFRAWKKTLMQAGSLIALVGSMLSYDGMIVAPLIYCTVSWFILGRKDKRTFVPLVLMPLYWLVRIASGAVPPSGDYGYKPTTLPFNIVGNSAGYILSTFLGPRVIEVWGTLREYLRVHRVIALGSGALIVGSCAAMFWKMRRHTASYRVPLVWAFSGMIALAAYLGLGNLSERYAYIASGFFIVSLGTGASVWLKDSRKTAYKVIGALVFTGLVVWNIVETGRLGSDWKKASSVSQDTLLTLSKLYFPLRENISFRFVNTPIRYGRAWIFPTGLEDPLWHIFHFNQYGYTTTNVASAQAAYELPVAQGFSPAVFSFEEYAIKKIERHVETVEVNER